MNSVKKSHQQNVDNIEKLTIQVATFDPVFNPSEARLTIKNQQLIKSKGDEVLSSLHSTQSLYDHAISARTLAFAGFDGLVTRILNAARISDIPEQTIGQIKSIVRDLRNKRAVPIEAPALPVEGTEMAEPVKHHKLHSGSFSAKIENFGILVMLLSTIPAYKPNETDLTIETLKAKLEALKLINTNCIQKDAEVSVARLQRDKLLYATKSGLVDIGADIKLYVKSAYGATSHQFKSVRGIAFTK